MSKNHAPGPVPPGNQPHVGTGYQPTQPDQLSSQLDTNAPGDQPQDPQRRLGDYEGKGEHSIQQPGGKNAGQRAERRDGGS